MFFCDYLVKFVCISVLFIIINLSIFRYLLLFVSFRFDSMVKIVNKKKSITMFAVEHTYCYSYQHSHATNKLQNSNLFCYNYLLLSLMRTINCFFFFLYLH